MSVDVQRTAIRDALELLREDEPALVAAVGRGGLSSSVVFRVRTVIALLEDAENGEGPRD